MIPTLLSRVACYFFIVTCCLIAVNGYSQITITINASSQTHPVSKYLYGRNNSLSDNPGSPLSSAEWLRLKDSGVTILRESGGNNCSKYNWRLKLSSHPDWYNNVYPHDWDFAAKSLQQNLPGVQGMWAFQLLGKAAKTNTSNFADWTFNTSQWWRGVNQNLAGGGTPNPSQWSQVTDPNNASTTTTQPGNIDQYLENWTADSTVLILDQWFDKLGLDESTLKYWNMDNEVEIWNGTHDDVMPAQITPEQFMQRYFEVAKKARAKFPDIKIVGPVVANEWQWYNWATAITIGGKNYPWLEFFIKRVAEEQEATGIKLLDVLDIHFYPGVSSASQIVQLHRVFFDKSYDFPEANGVRTINGGYDVSQTKEYILQRCLDWLDTYIGDDHGVTLGVTEIGVTHVNASTTAVWYAGTLGEFMRHPEMEIFTPWYWNNGMWEVLHLYSKYNKPLYVASTSSDEEFVSAYPTINAAGDSLTVTVVNRASSTKSVNVNVSNFDLADEPFNKLSLSSLPSSETFVSHSDNALKKAAVTATGNSIALSLPAMSITTLQLKGTKGEVITGVDERGSDKLLEVFPNPVLAENKLSVVVNETGDADLQLIDALGRKVRVIFNGKIASTPLRMVEDVSGLSRGVYFLRLNANGKVITRKVFLF